MSNGILISLTTPPLKLGDTAEYALGLLMECHLRHLPVVDTEGILQGVVSEDQLLDADGPEDTIATILTTRNIQPVSGKLDAHVFDLTRVMVEHGLSALPITDEWGHYQGLVRRHDIFEQFARMLSTHESGAILALEVAARDHSLARLIYVIEQNNVRVLSVATETADEGSNMIRVTLKMNVTDTTRVRHIIEHEGYRIVASFNAEDNDEELQDRIQEFMRYLEV